VLVDPGPSQTNPPPPPKKTIIKCTWVGTLYLAPTYQIPPGGRYRRCCPKETWRTFKPKKNKKERKKPKTRLEPSLEVNI
jgi:hypothetical protein